MMIEVLRDTVQRPVVVITIEVLYPAFYFDLEVNSNSLLIER
jgi:hypothetical protein